MILVITKLLSYVGKEKTQVLDKKTTKKIALSVLLCFFFLNNFSQQLFIYDFTYKKTIVLLNNSMFGVLDAKFSSNYGNSSVVQLFDNLPRSDGYEIDRIDNTDELINYINLSEVDSFWQQYNSLVDTTSPTRVFKSMSQSTFMLIKHLKRIYGTTIEDFKIDTSEIFQHTGSNRKILHLMCNIKTSKTTGKASLFFNVSDRQLGLRDISFVPIDYAKIAFIDNLLQPDVLLLKTNVDSLFIKIKRNNTTFSDKKISKQKKSLENKDFSVIQLLTSRLYSKKEDFYLQFIFEVEKQKCYLNLYYKQFNKFFILDDLDTILLK